MAPDFKKIVVNADGGCLQHVRPQGHQLLFQRALGRDMSSIRQGNVCRRRQRPAIDLAIGGQGQGRQLDEVGRQHVLRQRLSQMEP